jgi:hypothetical protein
MIEPSGCEHASSEYTVTVAEQESPTGLPHSQPHACEFK